MGKWCLFSGDVNQDQIIDLKDMTMVDNAIHNSASGYVVTDVNGDGIVNFDDIVIVNLNSSIFTQSKKP